MKFVGLKLTEEEKPQETHAAFVCPHCGKGYKTADGLKAHCKKEHPDAFDNDASEE